jgi:imidazolonepropionase-like amidohydrolase
MMKSLPRLKTIASLIALLAATLIMPVDAVEAQQPASLPVEQGARTAQGVYLIRNARIVTVSGPVIEQGSLLIRSGKIEAVGAVTAPMDAQVIDASGLTVYPGMIDLGTSLGLVEISSGAPGTVDLLEIGDMNPDAEAIVAVNPHSAHFGVTRFAGVTSALSLPRGGIISGQAALINLDGTTPREMAVTPTAALVINFPHVTAAGSQEFFTPSQQPNINEAISARNKQVEQLRKIWRDAEGYGRAQDAYGRDPRLPRPDQSVVLASLVPFVRGERPVIFNADRETEIRAALRFADEMHIQRPIILGGNDAWKVTSLLKEHDAPVILTGVLDLPLREDDFYDTLYTNAARLEQAGVRFCISTGDTGANVRDLPFQAGMAASFGLPRDEALKAVTLYPAQIIGAADRLGSIETGKLANLVIADGDLLEARTHVRYLFINGRQIPLVSRHSELYEQFKSR